MISFEFNVFNFLLVLIVAHLVNLFAIWSVHFLLHQKIFAIPFWHIHFNSHHRQGKIVDAKSLYWAIAEHSLWGILAVTYYVAYYVIFDNWIAWTFIIEGLVSISFTYYLHFEYDRRDSWLNRYDWFKRDRKLHYIHHGYYPKSTTWSSKNYAFGGPITAHLMDRLFGTFQPLKKTYVD